MSGMVRVLEVAHTKGGTGKSAIATNLAAMSAADGIDTLLVDADSDPSAALWNQIRREHDTLPQLDCVRMTGNITKDLKSISSKYKRIIIDAGGNDSQALRAGLVVADKVIVPTRPNNSDVWKVETIHGIIEQAKAVNERLQANLLINAAPNNFNSRRVAQVMQIMEHYPELPAMKALLHNLFVYDDAFGDGMGVVEFKPQNATACVEMKSLYEEVFNA